MSTIQQLRRAKRRWLIAQWSCGFLLALSVLLGMGAALGRLKQSVHLADDHTLSEEAWNQMIQQTLWVGKAGLILGALAFLAYLGAVIMHHHARQKLHHFSEQDQDLNMLEELLEEEGASPDEE